MKKKGRLKYILLMVWFLCPSIIEAAGPSVGLEVIHSLDRYPLGGRYPIVFRIKISKPWSIQSTKPDGGEIIPTVMSFHNRPDLRIEGLQFPIPIMKKLSFSPDPIEVYAGTILVRSTLMVGETQIPGEKKITGYLSYQACSDNACLPPEKIPVSIPLNIVAKDTPAKALNQTIFLSGQTPNGNGPETAGFIPRAGLWLTLMGIFLAGLALNLTPCIYPLIPITVSYFGGKSQKVQKNRFFHGGLYILGLAVTNSILGVSAALSGGMLGSALQNPAVLVFVAAVLIVLGLSFFGFWEMQIPLIMTRMASKNYQGYFGTFFMGLTLGVVAAPCLGPFILGLFTYVGQKGDPLLGFLYFFILSIGMGIPLSILAIFSGAIHRLPLSGDWMLWVRKFMGWVLIGMAAYMIHPLISHYLGKSGLFAGIAIAASIHLGWYDKTGKGLIRFSFFKKGVGIVLFCGALIYAFSTGQKSEGIQWISYDERIISTAKEEKKPTILDFYADWCSPCRALDDKVFSDPEIVKLSRSFVTARLDLTRRLPHQDKILREFGVRGVPTVIFFNRDGVEEKSLRIESYVSRSEFLKHLRKALSQ